MYFPMELEYNPTEQDDIDIERERRKEELEELASSMASSGGADTSEDDVEVFDAKPSPELEALLPYYNLVEEEALKVAKKYFQGSIVADSKDVHNQKLFEYGHNGHTYRCYVDIYIENEDEINIIEVKATTNSKYNDLDFTDLAPRIRGAHHYPLFVKQGNIWRLNKADSTITEEAKNNFDKKKLALLDRYGVGKYPHDIAFQRYVIDRVLHKSKEKKPVNYYLAVLNNEYVYDGALDAEGSRIYNKINDQEIITFYDMNEITQDYQSIILKEVAELESYISKPHDKSKTVPVGKWCEWGKNTECQFYRHCYECLRKVPDTNKANNYLSFRGFSRHDVSDKYQLINEGYYKLSDVPRDWLENQNHLIQRDCYDNNREYVDKEKMTHWLENEIRYPIYHFDFEAFPCPLPRFRGETPYRQSVFEFSLHVEREAGVCDKEKDNFIFLNSECNDDERKALAKAIVDHFEFNADGTLHGTMLAQNTSYEKLRLTELADLFPEYRKKLLAIRDNSADLIHLLRTNKELYTRAGFGSVRAAAINYYNKKLSGSYSIKKTLPVLVPSLTYKGMDVGNGVEAYITYINYDSSIPTFDLMKTKEDRRNALSHYCQQDTWAMVEILRAVRRKIM